MSTLRISDAPLLPDVNGTEKIPTGGRGDYAISVDQIKDHIFQDVGKELVGLGNVDNTSDLDKPVSTAQQAALNLKADKTYVDANLDLKADKTNVYTRSETTLALSTKADLVGGVIPSNQLPSYVDDVVEYTTSTLPIIGESGKIYVTTDTNRTWRWSGNQYVEISNGGVSDSTLKLQTPRKIANVDFDGTQNIEIPHNNLTNRNVENAHNASSISTANGETQQDINDYNGAKWRNKVGGYDLNARVVLENGDIVKSTVVGNTVNPNVDMTGWVNDAELQRIHNKSSATLTDYLLPAEIANSPTTDISGKLQAINDANIISKLRVPSGVWYINSPVIFNRDFAWDIDPDAFFKFGLNGVLKFEGSATLIGKPSANISNDTRTISVNHSGQLSPFDLICIYNPTDGSFTPQRPNYRAGEYMKVATVSAGAITTFGKTYESYDASVVDIYKINPIHIDFNRFNIIAENTAVSNPVIFSFCEGLDISNYYNYGSATAGLYLDRCYDVSVSSSSPTNNSAIVGLNYGVSLANCQNVRLYGITPLAARHGVAVGGGNSICSVPCREIYIDKSVLKTSNTTGIGAADFHGNVSDSVYDGCKIDHGVFGGKNLTVRNSFVNNRETDAACLIFQDLVGGEINIENITMTTTRGSTSAIAYLMFSLLNDLKEDLVINIKNLKITGSGSSLSNLILFRSGADVVITKKIIINIDGLDCRLSDQGSFLYIQGGTAQPIFPDVEINMSNIRSTKKNVYYVHPTTTATAPTTKLNLPKQIGSQVVTTAGESTGVKLGDLINLPYYYPIPASVIASVGSDGSWSVDSTFNLKPVSVISYGNMASQVRFAIVSPSALPTSKVFKISYEVGI